MMLMARTMMVTQQIISPLRIAIYCPEVFSNAKLKINLATVLNLMSLVSIIVCVCVCGYNNDSCSEQISLKMCSEELGNWKHQKSEN